MLNYLNAKAGSIKDAFGLFSYTFLEEHPLDFRIRDNGFLVASANFKLDTESNWKHIEFVFSGNGNVEITAPDKDGIFFTGIYPIDGTDSFRDKISDKIKLIHGIYLNFKGK